MNLVSQGGNNLNMALTKGSSFRPGVSFLRRERERESFYNYKGKPQDRFRS